MPRSAGLRSRQCGHQQRQAVEHQPAEAGVVLREVVDLRARSRDSGGQTRSAGNRSRVGQSTLNEKSTAASSGSTPAVRRLRSDEAQRVGREIAGCPSSTSKRLGTVAMPSPRSTALMPRMRSPPSMRTFLAQRLRPARSLTKCTSRFRCRSAGRRARSSTTSRKSMPLSGRCRERCAGGSSQQK